MVSPGALSHHRCTDEHRRTSLVGSGRYSTIENHGLALSDNRILMNGAYVPHTSAECHLGVSAPLPLSRIAAAEVSACYGNSSFAANNQAFNHPR
jgi:hypothetical protein